ncbi:MAG: hypothetical protein Q4E33_01805 [Erysipelotrichaceae bacterium]|nr:hypothetical protein [Erysipelotrichaceae bacterium]
MRCLFCDKEITKYSIKSILLYEDELCPECRRLLKVNRRTVSVDKLKVETFFDYDGIYRSLLIQYKECYDEALKNVFIYDLKEYIAFKYLGYKILYVPSSNKKIKERGYNHLELMFESLNFKKVEGLRIKEDLIQEGKNAKERKQMINNYIYEGSRQNKVLIVDDVLTTGSSIRGVYETIFPYANKIKCLVLASKRKRFHI